MENPELREKFEQALEKFVNKAKEDTRVLAIILLGSLAYDLIWKNSDINVYVITTEGQHKFTYLIENDILFATVIYNKKQFMRALQRGRASIYYNRDLSVAKVLYSKDEAITKLVERISEKVNEKDSELFSMFYNSVVHYDLEKAAKMLYIKKDLASTFFFLILASREFATSDCYRNYTYTLREEILRARKFYPDFYQSTYDKLITEIIDYDKLEEILEKMYEYYDSTHLEVWKPLLDHISEKGGSATSEEILTDFGPRDTTFYMTPLVKRGIVSITESPVKITKKSLVDFYQPNYHFDRESFDKSKISPTKFKPNLQNEKVKEKYKNALNSLLEKVKKDRTIISLILCGSLSYDTVWENSDLDVIMVTSQDVRRRFRLLIEKDVLIDCLVYSRDEFRKRVQTVREGSIFHSYFSKSQVIYTSDNSIYDLYEDFKNIGSRDLEMVLLTNYFFCKDLLDKTRRWFTIKDDPINGFHFLISCIRRLASIEVLLNNAIPLREVISQALLYNPVFFNKIYKELMLTPIKSKESLVDIIVSIEDYLEDKLELFAKPIINYIRKEGEVTQTDLENYCNIYFFLNFSDFVDKGIIQRKTAPYHFTRHSIVEMNQPSYFFSDDLEEQMMLDIDL